MTPNLYVVLVLTGLLWIQRVLHPGNSGYEAGMHPCTMSHQFTHWDALESERKSEKPEETGLLRQLNHFDSARNSSSNER